MSVSSVRPVLFQTMKNVMSRAPMMTKFYMDQEKVENNSEMLLYSKEVHNHKTIIEIMIYDFCPFYEVESILFHFLQLQKSFSKNSHEKSVRPKDTI